MRAALLLVDLRVDLLARAGLTPLPSVLVDGAARLLVACRQGGVPVVHVHTRVEADSGRLRARTGEAAAALAPEPLRPRAEERFLTAPGYSAFGESGLEPWLREQGIDTLVLGGLDLHGCVRATVLDAAERGFTVQVAEDAIGSTEPDQAEMTRLFLEGRSAEFLETEAVRSRLGLAAPARSAAESAERVPPAWIGGVWERRRDGAAIERRNPSDWRQVLATVTVATQAEVGRAAEAAARGQRSWAQMARAARTAVLEAWASGLEARSDALVACLALELGKPVTDGREEVRAAVALVRASSRRAGAGALEPAGSAWARNRPQGVVGLVTPWNNPLAIAVGKIAPALAAGNGVVWKPASEAPRTAMAVCETLEHAGVEPGLVNLVFGEAEVARRLIDHPSVSAVSLTGSTATGRAAAVRCIRRSKPFQAELGGNNAAIVLGGCDFSAQAHQMARAAFSFAGQRCTAISRFVVVRAVFDAFLAEFTRAVTALRAGDPRDTSTEIGPVVSRVRREWVRSRIDLALATGAELYAGGAIPSGLEEGCWITPAVLGGIAPDAPVAREEIFGPVAIVLPAADLDEALRIANGVEHGLVGALYGGGPAERQLFTEAIEAGVVNLSPGPVRVDPEAPFGGWKSSGFGPPEHGLWDERFYARPQAVYPARDSANE